VPPPRLRSSELVADRRAPIQVTASKQSAAERIGLVVLCVVLLAGGAAAWWVRLQPPLQVDIRPLAALPAQAGAWRAQDVPIQDDVADELAADFNIQRDYRHATGARVWVYIGYYSTARGGRPEHTPRACYTGAGWALLATDVRTVDGGRSRIQEFLVERGGQRRLVHFWYRTHRQTGLTSGLNLSIDRLIGRFTTGRADGALVRLSTPLRPGEDLSAARSRLASLRASIVPQLEGHWPIEGSGASQHGGRLGAGPAHRNHDLAAAPSPREPVGREFNRRVGNGASPADARAAPTARRIALGSPRQRRARAHGLSSNGAANHVMGR